MKTRVLMFAICACVSVFLSACVTRMALTPVPLSRTPAPMAAYATTSGDARPPAFAGQFYPGDPDELADTVDGFLNAVSPVDGDPMALIAPHAGYVFSGQVAAYSFKQLVGRDVDVVIIIASDHQQPLSSPVAVWPDGAWATPLGEAEVDTALAQALVDADRRIRADAAAFTGEHPIEVELPFIQRACPACLIVPILMSEDSPEAAEALSEALIKVLPGRYFAGRKAVILASSDLSHYPPYETAQRVDRITLNAITGYFDPDIVRETISGLMTASDSALLTCACGEGPILTAIRATKGWGANTATLLHYANSGDVPEGDPEQVVGYGAVMFWQYQPVPLTEEQQTFLLDLARETIAARLTGKVLSAPSVDDPALLRPLGVFVTLRIGEELRGCIGNFSPEGPLWANVRDMALAAAFEDMRFSPLTLDELSSVTLEISILSPMQPSTPDAVEIGRDGLVIVSGWSRGVFLPQVPVEQEWDLDAYLENLCYKANLSAGCWKRKEAKLFSFTAEVFGEEVGSVE